MENNLVGIDVTQTILNARSTGISRVSFSIIEFGVSNGHLLISLQKNKKILILDQNKVLDMLKPSVRGENLNTKTRLNLLRTSSNSTIQRFHHLMSRKALRNFIDFVRSLIFNFKVKKITKSVINIEVISLAFFPEPILNSRYKGIIENSGINYSMLCHDVFPLTNPDWFTISGVERFQESFQLYLKATKIICNSGFTKKTLSELLQKSDWNSKKQIKTIELGSLISKSSSERNERRNTILYVASIQPRKNHIALLNALEVLDEFDLEVEVVLIYGDSWLSDQFSARIRELKLRNVQINLKGKVTEEELEEYYKSSRASIFISEAEGFGLPVLESLCCGTPVIILQNESTGHFQDLPGTIFIKDKNSPELARAIYQVFTDSDQYELITSAIKQYKYREIDDFCKALFLELALPL